MATPRISLLMLISSVAWVMLEAESIYNVDAGKAKVKVGNTSEVEDAASFRIYYGHTFKVIKNGVDGMSYLLIQISCA